MTRLKHLSLVALAALLLGACSNAVAPTATSKPTDEPTSVAQATAIERATQAPPSTATSAPTEAATKTEPSPAATATTNAQPTDDAPAPDVVPAFLEVQPDEWVHGPPDAPVTIIEYSDFQ